MENSFAIWNKAIWDNSAIKKQQCDAAFYSDSEKIQTDARPFGKLSIPTEAVCTTEAKIEKDNPQSYLGDGIKLEIKTRLHIEKFQRLIVGLKLFMVVFNSSQVANLRCGSTKHSEASWK